MREMKRQPTHPGKIIKDHYLSPLSITIKEMASRLNISRKTLSQIINGKSSISMDIALRLSRAFETTPDLWMNLQMKYDLWQSENSNGTWRQVKPIPNLPIHI